MLWILAEHNIETTVYAYNTNFAPRIVDKVVAEHILYIHIYPFWDSISTSPGFTISQHYKWKFFLVIIIT